MLATAPENPIPKVAEFVSYRSFGATRTHMKAVAVTRSAPRYEPFGAVYYPTSILPGWMQLLSRISPATYVLDAVRRALIDGAPASQLLPDLWPLIVMAFVFLPPGLWGFGKAEHYAKRTGKLKRVG